MTKTPSLDIDRGQYDQLCSIVLVGFYESRPNPTLDTLVARHMLHQYPNGYVLTIHGIKAVDKMRREIRNAEGRS